MCVKEVKEADNETLFKKICHFMSL